MLSTLPGVNKEVNFHQVMSEVAQKVEVITLLSLPDGRALSWEFLLIRVFHKVLVTLPFPLLVPVPFYHFFSQWLLGTSCAIAGGVLSTSLPTYASPTLL